MKGHPKFSFQRLVGIISKEFLQMRRDRLTFAMVIAKTQKASTGMRALRKRRTSVVRICGLWVNGLPRVGKFSIGTDGRVLISTWRN